MGEKLALSIHIYTQHIKLSDLSKTNNGNPIIVHVMGNRFNMI